MPGEPVVRRLPGAEELGRAAAYALNALVLRTVECLAESGVEPPVWRSGNAPGGDAPGGDEANARFLAACRSRVRKL